MNDEKKERDKKLETPIKAKKTKENTNPIRSKESEIHHIGDEFFNQPLSEGELREIFGAKCQDFRIKFNEKLFQRFLRRQQDISSAKVLRLESSGFGPIAASLIIEAIFRRTKLRYVDISDREKISQLKIHFL